MECIKTWLISICQSKCVLSYNINSVLLNTFFLILLRLVLTSTSAKIFYTSDTELRYYLVLSKNVRTLSNGFPRSQNDYKYM